MPDPERERLVEEFEEAAYEQDCSAERLRLAMNAAHEVDALRDADYRAWQRKDAARKALAAHDRQQGGEG